MSRLPAIAPGPWGRATVGEFPTGTGTLNAGERPWPRMRALAAIALAVLLSGCVLVKEDTGDEGDQAGDPMPTGGNGGPGQGFAPQQGTAHGSNHGIELDVAWRACEAGFCANATATNRGDVPVSISNICVPPWAERMRKDGQEVQHQEGRAYCAAYGVRDFEPGEKAYADFTWDQRIWDGVESQPAPQGAYRWTIAFWWQDQATQERREVTADIDLVVGET